MTTNDPTVLIATPRQQTGTFAGYAVVVQPLGSPASPGTLVDLPYVDRWRFVPLVDDEDTEVSLVVLGSVRQDPVGVGASLAFRMVVVNPSLAGASVAQGCLSAGVRYSLETADDTGSEAVFGTRIADPTQYLVFVYEQVAGAALPTGRLQYTIVCNVPFELHAAPELVVP